MTYSKTSVYLLFIGFCLFSALRDVWSEQLFKTEGSEIHPLYMIFVYALVTQITCALILFSKNLLNKNFKAWNCKKQSKDLLWLNLFTFLSYTTYFWAISTSLGASINSIFEYGSTPIFTFLTAILLLGEKPSSRFYISCFLCFLSILIFSSHQIEGHQVNSSWYLGIFLSLFSSACGAIYRIFYKKLLNQGLDIASVLFYRLMLITISAGIFLILKPEYFNKELFPKLLSVGFVGFTIPMLLVLYVIKKLNIHHFALFLFLVPILTYFFSYTFGLVTLHTTDIVAGIIMFLSIFYYEKEVKKQSV